MSSEVVASSLNLDEQQQSSHTVQADRVQSILKVNLLGMSRPQLEKFFEEMGEKIPCWASNEMDSSVFCH
jgi:23S rRNA (adenine2503-C2)-methyltransferase